MTVHPSQPLTLREVLESKDVSLVVDFAIVSNRVAKKAVLETEAVKPFLRDAATAVAGRTKDATSVDLKGELGVVQVVFPVPHVQAKRLDKDKSADLFELEFQIGAEVFESFFKKKVVVEFKDDAGTYQEKLAKLSPAQQKILKEFVEVVDSTPRVNIAK